MRGEAGPGCIWLAVIAALGAGCGDDSAPPAGTVDGGDRDAGTDSGLVPEDAGSDAGSDGGADVDGGPPPYDVSCVGRALPTPPDPLSITVRIRSTPLGALEGAHVEARRRADDSLVAEGDTVADGTVRFDLPTGGVPADVYFVVTAADHPVHRLYTGWPLYEDETMDFGVYAYEILAAAEATSGVTFDESRGHIHVTARDCGLRVVEGAELFVSPAPEELAYLVGEACFTLGGDRRETGPCGSGLALNVPAGSAAVTASLVEGEPLRMQVVRIEPGAITGVTLRPDRP